MQQGGSKDGASARQAAAQDGGKPQGTPAQSPRHVGDATSSSCGCSNERAARRGSAVRGRQDHSPCAHWVPQAARRAAQTSNLLVAQL